MSEGALSICLMCREKVVTGTEHLCVPPMTDLEALGFVEDLLANALEQATLPELEASSKDQTLLPVERENAARCVKAGLAVLAGMRRDVARLTSPRSVIRPAKADRDLILRSFTPRRTH